MLERPSQWPVALIEDRYGGCYSGGKWIAISNSDQLVDLVNTRVQFCLVSDDGPSGDDTSAGIFWDSAPTWVAVGPTPSSALDKLRSNINADQG